MTLVLKLEYDYTNNVVSMSGYLKVTTQTDRQTHRQGENITFLHMRAVNIIPNASAKITYKLCHVTRQGVLELELSSFFTAPLSKMPDTRHVL